MAKAKIKKEINITATAKYSQLEKLNQSIQRNQSSLKKFQVQLAVAAPLLQKLASSALSAAQASLQLGSQIKDLSDKAGVGTEQIQVLGRVAAQNGSSMEEMGSAVIKLAKSAQEAASGNKQLSERFARLGIDVNKFKALSPEEQMERLGRAVAGASDRQATMVEVMALVGQDAGPKLMESLKKLGTEGYDTLAKKANASGEVLSGSAIQSLDRAGQAFKDLGHWFKVMTAEIAGAAFAVKDAVSEAIIAPKLQNLFQVIQKHGKDSYQAAEAYMRLAQERFAQGDRQSADRFLGEAEQWAGKVRAALSQVEQLERIKSATAQDWAEVNAATFDILKGNPEKARAFLASLDDTQAQWAKILESEEEAARVAKAAAEAALATGVAEMEAFFAPLDKLSETLREQKQKLAEALAKKDADLLASMRLDVLGGLEKMDAEAASASARLIERIDGIAFSQLSAGEQLLSQTAQMQTQLEQFYRAGVLGASQYAQAQEVLALQLKSAEGMVAYEGLGVAAKALVGEFERLDGVLETQLSGTIKDFVETGQADMKKLGQAILKEVIQSMLKALVLKPLLTGLGGVFGGKAGGFFSGLGGAMGLPGVPGRASGGPVTGARPYLVGEKGPELFIPPVSGQIIDANKTARALAGDTTTGGERGPQNIYQIDARGADAGAVTRLEAALFKLAGPGVVEKRAHAAHAERTRRG